MAIQKANAYTWYVYKAGGTYLLKNTRRQEGYLVKGKFFGLRQAGSDKGVYRLVLKDLGLGAVFSLPGAAVQKLLELSSILKNGLPQPDPVTKKLISRLERADPNDFWSVVSALNWPKHGKAPGYAATARQALHECYGVPGVKRLLNTAVRLRNQLQSAIYKYEKKAGEQLFLGGDDSLYDAVAHAVSMGREKCEAFLERPESFIKKFNRSPVASENFESCFI